MPYLNLGQTSINYENTRNDSFIITMILDTSCSYQYPVLVRDTPTLDIYFGKNFKYREFINEMLLMGVTFYLYRPIHSLDPGISWLDEIEQLKEQGVPDELIPDNHLNLPSQFIIPENSPSWKNRDTIRLFNHQQHNGFGFDYCYPEYDKTYYYENSDGSQYYMGLGGAENSINNYRFDNEYETLAFQLNFTDVTAEDFEPYSDGSCKYIVIPYQGYNYMIWFMGNSDNPPNIEGIKSSMYIKVYSTGGQVRSKDDIINDLISLLERDFSISDPFGLGYDVITDNSNQYKFVISKRRSNQYLNSSEIVINIQTPEQNQQYYDLPNFYMNADFRRTNDILSEATESIKQLEFYSKTIGKGEEDIKITITRLINEDYEYRIVISRFDYEEFYEVNLSDTYKYNVAPLAGTINRNSKLVTCRLFDRVTSLPEGTFYLKGSYEESYTFNERRQALDIIKETDIYDDILLIDDLELWKSDATITTEDLKLFLDYSTEKDNQTYITNRSYRTVDPTTGGYNVYHEHRYNITDEDRWVRGLLTVREHDLFCNIDVILNVGDLSYVISDKQNRLVYFYNDMTYLKSYRPGSYVFIRGLLTDNYSVESTDIIYEVPSDSVIEELPEHKSNYMLYNNHYYFYPRYQNGGTSKITTVTRFIVSKIGREFRNNKWRIINMPVHERYKFISTLIRNIMSRFSIIRSLTIDEMSQTDNTMIIRLTSQINELAVKDITVNITLNYN